MCVRSLKKVRSVCEITHQGHVYVCEVMRRGQLDVFVGEVMHQDQIRVCVCVCVCENTHQGHIGAGVKSCTGVRLVCMRSDRCVCVCACVCV